MRPLPVPLLLGAITDSHFVSRDRMGRLIVFLARIIRDGWASQARGIGILYSVSATAGMLSSSTGSIY
jgi:cyanophycinase-like exopeptidase